ncbi:hypothetical protein NMY22_g17808 [Coprinellus aureogranulatus]|nr:hypothetical protein NMY22_g17808 [Coprinellus aureogranulatus]
MRTTVIFAIFLAFVASLVGASPSPRGLNARRMAEGLGPLPPVRRSPTRAAARAEPSGVNQCNTRPIQCCQRVTTARDPVAGLIISLLGIVIQDPNTVVGLTCSPVPATGTGANQCSAQPVCCQNNSFNGLIAIGCTPVFVVGASPPGGLDARRIAMRKVGVGAESKGRAEPSSVTQCGTNPVLCCEKVTTANDYVANMMITLLGAVVKDPSTVVGLKCVSAGATGSTCAIYRHPVCCQSNDYSGLLAVGCTPVTPAA